MILLKYDNGVHVFDDLMSALDKQAEIGGELFGPLFAMGTNPLCPYVNRLAELGMVKEDDITLSVDYCSTWSDTERRWTLHLGSQCWVNLEWRQVEEKARQHVAARECDLIALGM